MSKRILAVLSFATLVATAPAPALGAGYGVTGFGGKIGYTTPENLDGTTIVTGHAELERAGSALHLLPSLSYWNTNGVSDVNPNLDVYYHFAPEGQATPYVGGGFGLNLYDRERGGSETHPGINLIAGLRIPGPSSHYFVESRYMASDRTQFSVVGGVTMHLH